MLYIISYFIFIWLLIGLVGAIIYTIPDFQKELINKRQLTYWIIFILCGFYCLRIALENRKERREQE